MKIIGKIFSVLTSLILIASIILVGYAVFTVQKGGIPNVFGYSLMRVMSGSMEPEYPVGSYIIIKPADTSTLREGDVITYLSADAEILNMPVTHRIAAVSADESGQRLFITKGDANNIVDPAPVSEEKIIGMVWTKLNFLNFLNVLTDNPKLFLLVIVLPMVILALFFFVKLIIITQSGKGGKE